MKTILIAIALFFLMSFVDDATGAHQFTVTSTDNVQHPLQNYQGKKIWLIVLPVNTVATTADSALLKYIDSVSLLKTEQYQTIVVPSYEDGYNDSVAGQLNNWYQSTLNSGVVVSKGLYTHKTSGSTQDALFAWLTHTDQNMHFDNEAGSAGAMYFINEAGELTGVLEASQPGAEMQRMIAFVDKAMQ